MNSWTDPFHSHSKNRGAARILTILLPEHFGAEFIDIYKGETPRELLLEDYLDSLIWRTPETFSVTARSLFEEAASGWLPEKAFATQLSLACVPGHPLNAEAIHQRLSTQSTADRDHDWTIPLADNLGEHSGSRADLFVRWLLDSQNLPLSDEQLRLIGLLISWFFTSNDRGFRRQAIIAAARILTGHASIAGQLVEIHQENDDPYVFEGVMAVASAVAIRETCSSKLQSLAEIVYRAIFDKGEVYPHVLIRDYGFIVLSVAENRNSLPRGIYKSDYSPPYRSRWPVIPKDDELENLDKNKDWQNITSSIEPEYRGKGIGGYGDFGRYVMDAHVHQWLKTPISSPYPKDRNEKQDFSGSIARRYILNRVAALGWSPNKFLAYDQAHSTGRLNSSDEEWKVERIGKKYQWIALAELEAYLSDHYHFGSSYSDSEERFEGAWQLYSRNFDPARPLEDPMQERSANLQHAWRQWWVQYPNPFSDLELIADRSAWVRKSPESIEGMLSPVSGDQRHPGDWILLNGYTTWKEPDAFPPRDAEFGDLEMFMHSRAWIVDRAKLRPWLKYLAKQHFFGRGIQVPVLENASLYDYPWGNAHRSLREKAKFQRCFGSGHDFPEGLLHTSCEYAEGWIIFPSPFMIQLLGLRWKPDSYEFVDQAGETIIYQLPERVLNGHPPCLVKRDRLINVLHNRSLALIWGTVGERSCHNREGPHGVCPADAVVSFSMVHWLEDDGRIDGGLTQTETIEFGERDTNKDSAYPQPKRRSFSLDLSQITKNR